MPLIHLSFWSILQDFLGISNGEIVWQFFAYGNNYKELGIFSFLAVIYRDRHIEKQVLKFRLLLSFRSCDQTPTRLGRFAHNQHMDVV